MHSNVTSKIVVGFILRGPPCRTFWLHYYDEIFSTVLECAGVL